LSTPGEVAACWDAKNAASGAPGGPDGHHDGPDCAGLSTPGEVAACWDAKNAAPGAPGGPDGHHPPGEHHDGPPPGEDCANKPTPEETAACWDQQGGHMDHPGDHPPGEHHDGPPPTMAPPMGDPNMPPTMAPNMGDPNMPPPTMAPPMGDHSGMPPMGMSNLGAHCGEIQAKNEKKRMRKEAKCLRRALNEHKPDVKLRQTKDGLGAYGCGVKKTGSKPAQIACLRDLLDGPGGEPGMAPGTEHP